MTLKKTENTALTTEINYILTSIKIENGFLNNQNINKIVLLYFGSIKCIGDQKRLL